MAIKIIKKGTEIKSSKENVWEVLTQDRYTRAWYTFFSEGTHAVSDWSIGSKALFIDNSNGGMVGKIIDNKPNEFLEIEYTGIVGPDGIEDYDSDLAKSLKGGRETYRLTEKEGITNLSVSGEGDMSESFYESMSTAWEKAVQKIKELSEIMAEK